MRCGRRRLHDLDEDAAEAEHQHRAVLRVGGDAADHFAGAFDHFLNDDAFKPVEQAALVELGDEVAVFGAKRLAEPMLTRTPPTSVLWDVV